MDALGPELARAVHCSGTNGEPRPDQGRALQEQTPASVRRTISHQQPASGQARRTTASPTLPSTVT